ncbi:MAG: lysine--tRNA ligase [Verrucomicrobiota bacterium]|jgi:lysyl-tRNA synthetase class 2
MDDANALIEQRKAKLAALRAKGIDPFKNKFAPAETCQHARDHYAEGREVALAGRITAHRDMGKSMFMDIRDQSGRIQIYAQKNVLGDEQWNLFRHLDLADFIGVRGTMFTTKTKEISVKITGFVILAKALRPPPAKWHGLEDTEIRYRQRYLDLMANPEVKDVFLKRSRIIAEIRNFLHSRGFVEVETPMMQAIPGGAAAQPFKTHHNALGCDFYLRIALELPLKRMLVGGVDKVFELGRVFRNEGLSRKHNPEFTMLEAYQAFGDYDSMMELVQGMVCHVAQKVLGTLVVTRNRNNELVTELKYATSEIVQVLPKFFAYPATSVDRETQDRLINSFPIEANAKLQMLYAQVGQQPYWKVAKESLELIDKFIQQVEATKLTCPTLFGTVEQQQEGQTLLHTIRGRLERFAHEDTQIDLTPPWRRVKYKDLIRERIDSGWFEISSKERLIYAEQLLGVEVGGRPQRKLGETAGKWLPFAKKIKGYIDQGLKFTAILSDEDKKQFDEMLHELSQRTEYLKMGIEDFEVTQAVFEKLIEPTLIQPTFVTHTPKELIPLAKLSPDDPTTVEVFECCINGQEIAPAYTEQNDPIAQRERLEHQAGGEQQKLDEDFLVALEHGMPPAGGMGMGIDRLCMMLLGQESIRDVILFPQLKPK